MAYEIEAGFESICRKILESSRNALYINMRYLDVALSSLAWEITTDIPRIGTDGLKIAYEPHYLADLYRKNPMLVNRVYLHMVFHCIFRHLFRPCPEDRELWNLSCDMAVEALIDGMHHRSIRMGVHPFRRAVYDELRKNLKVLTAEGIYRWITEMLSEVEVSRWEMEFRLDDHSLWQQEPKNGPRNPSPNRKKWDDIRERMETEVMLFSNEASEGEGDLKEQLRVSNRSRYDYKEFLRKFTVLHEEMQIDPDSFDYIFYHYGMEMYGNMPLIEPLETSEVRKIEEFVIVIDTSMSCKEGLVKRFLEETYDVLSQTENFFKRMRIHIIQCDERVQSDVLIESQEALKQYMEHFAILGGGGTDFRPVFAYVEEQLAKKKFWRLRGLLYFTDGYGVFPVKMPPYETAFIFVQNHYRDVDVPAWAIKLILQESDLEK